MSQTITTDQIEDCRIVYRKVAHGMRVEGRPFMIEFDRTIHMAGFYEEIANPDAPWHLFALKNNLKPDYWRISAVLLHVEDDRLEGSSKLDMELCPEWLRVYVKEDADAERVKAFVDEVLTRYPGEVRVE